MHIRLYNNLLSLKSMQGILLMPDRWRTSQANRRRHLCCRQLSLSTNSIDKIGGLGGMASLKTLSLARNLIRKIEGLEPVASTLEQLWLSYNQLERLVSLWHPYYACCIRNPIHGNNRD